MSGFSFTVAAMDITVSVSDSSNPNTLRSVLAALRAQKLEIQHGHKNWGDWIRLDGCETVISIEVTHGLTSSATIEHPAPTASAEPTELSAGSPE